MRIESTWKEVNTNPQTVFEWLSDMNNVGKLMPSQITNWKSDQESCSYTINGMADINMKIDEKRPTELIKMISFGKNPFSFEMNINIKPKGEHTDVQLTFNGDVNPFLKMMVEKPLSNFIDLLGTNLQKQF
ncbi:MAG: SRPBCC family protein [Flavobacteriales bacterium]